MTKDQVIQMARECGLSGFKSPTPETVMCAKTFYLAAYMQGQRGMREACASIVQSNAEACDTYSTARRILESNAAAIRALPIKEVK